MKTFTAYRPDAAKHGKHMPHQLNAPNMPQYQGVVFDDGSVAIRWLTAKRSTALWDSLADCMDIHGHAEYGTYLVWGDGRTENYVGDGKFEPRPEQQQCRICEKKPAIKPFDHCGSADCIPF